MKKKIAVFANGLNAENLMKFMKGIKEKCRDNYADFHVFVSYDTFGMDEESNRAEYSIYDLPIMSDYDGAVIFSPGLNFEEVNDKIARRCREAGIPTICISGHYEDTIRIHTNNYEGMSLVVNHLLDEHCIKSALFIAGPQGNAESDERLQAVKDAFEKRNITLDDDDIFYSNWVNYLATEFVRNRHLSEAGLPDAIICANDSLAHFICFVLEDMGVRCPQDVLVTGFDGDYQSLTFYPSITTAAQPFYMMGVKTVDFFDDIFEGRTVSDEYYIPCSLVRAESCGCDTSVEYDRHRRSYSIKSYRKEIVNDLHLSQVKSMTDAVLQSDSFSNLDHYLQEYFYKSDGFERNPFFICIDPEFARLSEIDVSQLPKYSYSDTFCMLVGKDGEKHYAATTFKVSDGVVPVESADGQNHIYVFQSIYYKSFVCGYTIMTDSIDYFGTSNYRFLHIHFNRLLNQYVKNMQLTYLNAKLSKLMNTDALTSTKNRMAFEMYKQQLSEDIDKGWVNEVAILVADINNLKSVNDNLGHESGDQYIKNASKFMCMHFKHSPVFRIGGDEFLIVLKDKDFKQRFELAKKMEDEMIEIEGTELNQVEKISIAFAFADYDKSVDENIDDTIKRADELMYENKRAYKGRFMI